MIDEHTLYVYNTWSSDGMRIVGNHYLLIFASNATVEKIIEEFEPDSIKMFFEVLDGAHIKYEKIVIRSLNNLRYMEAGTFKENYVGNS